MDNIQVTKYATLLSQISVGLYQYKVLLKCGLCNVSNAIQMVSISYVITKAESDLNLSSHNKGFLTAIIFAGMIFGALIGGSLADYSNMGRRKTLQYSTLINSIFGLLSSICNNSETLILVRFFCGMGVGSSIAVLWTYVSEFFDANNRSKHVAILSISFGLGVALTSLIAWLVFGIASHSDNNITIGIIVIAKWRLFLIFCIIPSLITLIIFTWFADNSPKFLLFGQKDFIGASKLFEKMNQENKSNVNERDFDPNELESIFYNYSCNVHSGVININDHDIENDASDKNINYNIAMDHNHDIDTLNLIDSSNINVDDNSSKRDINININCGCNKKRINTGSKIIYLFTDKKLRRNQILGIIVWFCLSFGYNGLLEWLPSYLDTINGNVNVYFSTIATQTFQIPNVILCAYLIDPNKGIKWFDQRKVLAIAMFCGAVSLIGLLFIETGWQIVLMLCIFNAIVEPGWSSLNVVSTELSPTHVRSTSYAVFSCFGRIGAIMGNLAFGYFGKNDFASPLAICGVCMFIGSVSVLMFPNMKGKEVM